VLIASTVLGRDLAPRVADLGWLPRQSQVGLTRRSIAPLLYIAVALRGAPVHVAGIRRAGFVVAINNDPEAPIFKHADRYQVADYAKAVPALTGVTLHMATNLSAADRGFTDLGLPRGEPMPACSFRREA
jgi:electron transfer flavoprotein alpha subunit